MLTRCENLSQRYPAAGYGGDLCLALRSEGDPGFPDAGSQRLCGITYGDLQHNPYGITWILLQNSDLQPLPHCQGQNGLTSQGM